LYFHATYPDKCYSGLEIHTEVNTAVQLDTSRVGETNIFNRQDWHWKLSSIWKRPIPLRIYLWLVGQPSLELLLKKLLTSLSLANHLDRTVLLDKAAMRKRRVIKNIRYLPRETKKQRVDGS
jgi:hypothetical protein